MEQDLGVLSNEITYRKYLLEKVNLKKMFKDISIMDYNAMQAILKFDRKNEESERIYLRDLAEELKIPISRASQMIGRLQDSGMVKWKHDGKGERGTYIMITDRGSKAVEEQHAILKKFYGRVIERYGKDKFVEMLAMVTELENIMTEEVEKFREEK